MPRYLTENPSHLVKFLADNEHEVLLVLKEAILSIPPAMNDRENRFDLGKIIELAIPDHFTKERDPEHYFSHTPGEGLDITYHESDYSCKVSIKGQEEIFSRPVRGGGGRTAPRPLKIKNSLGEFNDLLRTFDYLLAIQKRIDGYGFGLANFDTVNANKIQIKDGVSTKLQDTSWLILSNVSVVQQREMPTSEELNNIYRNYQKDLREALKECVRKKFSFITKTAA